MTPAEKRERLRGLVRICPTCEADEETADEILATIPDDDLDLWIIGHAPPKPQRGPVERFDPCHNAGHRVCKFPRHHLGPCSPVVEAHRKGLAP